MEFVGQGFILVCLAEFGGTETKLVAAVATLYLYVAERYRQ